ncbi:hypothetical protein [Mycobacterium europaeum]|uniref:hypothetical protein n=1 Tax=Mycobacterium europaeum TaxID=761804 RepID=UPI001301FAB6
MSARSVCRAGGVADYAAPFSDLSSHASFSNAPMSACRMSAVEGSATSTLRLSWGSPV